MRDACKEKNVVFGGHLFLYFVVGWLEDTPREGRSVITNGRNKHAFPRSRLAVWAKTGFNNWTPTISILAGNLLISALSSDDRMPYYLPSDALLLLAFILPALCLSFIPTQQA